MTTYKKTEAENMRVWLDQAMSEGDPLVTDQALGGGDKVVTKLAEAGQGTVYVGYNFDTHRKVAVKFVLRDKFQDDEGWRDQQDRFLQEVVILEELHHPNIPIVKYYSPGNDATPPHMVMEYIEGDALSDDFHNANVVDRRSLEWKLERLRMFPDVCDALAVVHSRGMVHRDLKPDNLMITTAGDGHKIMKVIDFGIALKKGIERRTKQGLSVGTLGYLAPEQAFLDTELSKRADVYSLGAVLYEVLHWEGYLQPEETQQATLLKAYNPEYFEGRMNELFAEAKAFVSLAMANDAKERFGGMYELKGALIVLIKQLEYMHQHGLKRCPYQETQRIMAKLQDSGLMGHLEYFGATRMLARQYEISSEAGYCEEADKPQYHPSSSRALSRASSLASMNTQIAPETYEEEALKASKKSSRGLKIALAVAMVLLVLALAAFGVMVFGEKPRDNKAPQPTEPRYQSTAIVYNDARAPLPKVLDSGLKKPEPEAMDASIPSQDASSKPDATAAVQTHAQKIKALYTERDNWCMKNDKHGKNNGYKKMWTFHLSCHRMHLRSLIFKEKKYEAAFRYAQYLYHKFCADRHRKWAEKPLRRECKYLLRTYQKIKEKSYMGNRKVYDKYKDWSPFLKPTKH